MEDGIQDPQHLQHRGLQIVLLCKFVIVEEENMAKWLDVIISIAHISGSTLNALS